MKQIQIAIDGPASSGKSTVAKIIAKDLGYTYLDTGAMYRAATYLALQHQLTAADTEDIIRLLDDYSVSFGRSESGQQLVFVGDVDVTNPIRENDVTNNVSWVSAIPEVREKLVSLQQQIASQGGIVMDGRDIGTVVLPDAELKIFLVASVKERALRRFKENQEKGIELSLEKLEEDSLDVQAVITAPSRELARQIYEAAKQIAQFSEQNIRLANYIGGTDKLRQIKVEVIQASVIECKSHAVVIEKSDGQISEIPCATTLWAAGVKGNHVIENSGLADKNSRVEVDPFLRLPKCKFDKNQAEISKNLDENHTNTNQAKSTCEGSLQNVFVIGDCAIAVARDVIHAPTAQLAYQMGDYCADAIKRILHEKPLEKPFKFKHRGTVCSLGHTYAVGQIYGFGISGEKAAFMKNFILFPLYCCRWF